MPSGKPYRWEFEKHGQSLVIDPKGRLTLDSPEIMAEAALSGLGIAYVPERVVAGSLADGRLVKVLEDWCPLIQGLFLYYPGHRHIPSGLQAFIEVLRETA
jgi:DNA-binding transcriptional LysR family regulator